MYKWVKGNSFNKVATIYSGNITLNVPCISLFENVNWCIVGIDSATKKVGIKCINKDDIAKKTYNEDTYNKVSVGKSFVRISNKSLINEISALLKEEASGQKFAVSYNPKEKMIEIDLNNPQK